MSDYYAQTFAPHLRLAMLRFLAGVPEYRANCAMLRDAVDGLGIAATRDQVRTEIAWLRDQGLVTSEEPRPGLVVATASERGIDAASGRAIVPGVQRPAPKH